MRSDWRLKSHCGGSIDPGTVFAVQHGARAINSQAPLKFLAAFRQIGGPVAGQRRSSSQPPACLAAGDAVGPEPYPWQGVPCVSVRDAQPLGKTGADEDMVRKKPQRKVAGERETKPFRKSARRPQRMHPAGPHARPELTDDDATPGTGALPDISSNDRDVDPGTD